MANLWFYILVIYLTQNFSLANIILKEKIQCNSVKNEDKLDCFPRGNANKEECEKRGCCWVLPNKVEGLPNVPYCFYQPKTTSYVFKNITSTPKGMEAFLERSNNSPYPKDILTIKLIVSYLSDNTLRMKIIDPSNQRYESLFPEEQENSNSVKNPLYKFEIRNDKQGFRVIRKSDKVSIFDVSDMANFIYSDQFLQLTTKLPSDNIYGLGEQRKRFKLSKNWTQITLFNHDTEPKDNVNIYGTHPFYLLIENSTKANGVFLKNSNAMDLIIQPSGALTYRTIGGVFDFFIFLGPTPSDVLKQYQEIIGKPKMPPYWSLGFHLCRFGYNDLATTKMVLKRNLDAGILIETQWNDLDYMDKHNDFTYDKEKFAGLPEFVQDLHKQGRRYVVIVDPGVSGAEPVGTYPPYDRGVDLDVFVKNSTGGIFYGKVWNYVSTVFPDFTHPNAYTYWKEMLKNFHDKIPIDGAWIDMNEPSNNELPYGCPNSNLETPPYLPNIMGESLRVKTFCMTAKQHGGVHYNLHNLYGISEANVTSKVLSEILGERSLVISRSTFPGQGRYGGHWSGDISSNWDDLFYSIPHLLDFSLFGIPLMGADICGFNDDTTEDLCNRWMQLGAFYPFSRNHNSMGQKDQDPAILGPQVIRSSIKAYRIRYSLLPYLYTLFWKANTEGTTVARPLVIEFPEDPNTYDIDNSFLWGSALLIAPVLENDPSSISVYLPKGFWYDFYTHKRLESKGEFFQIKTDKDTIPLFIRGGQILFMQFPADTTEEVRKSDLRILAALNEKGEAEGEFYWDDGVTEDVGEDYTNIKCTASNGLIKCLPLHIGKTTPPKIFSVEIIGLDNSNHIKHNEDKKSVRIENLNIKTYPTVIQY